MFKLITSEYEFLRPRQKFSHAVEVKLNKFNTSVGRSYQCESRQVFQFDGTTDIKANITLQNMQLEAYRTAKDTKFSNRK